jgi:DNA polymerase III epsilon subunit family exonuclease
MADPSNHSQPPLARLTFFPQQLRAVTASVGPILVLAGPGAGKTRCLTGRIGHLIAERAADPARICAITFTNKAAEEVRTRLLHELGELAEHLTLGTIHALCLDLLRAFGRRAGLPAGFGVADETHQKLILNRLGVHSRRHRALLTLFGRHRLHGYALTPQDELLFRRYQHELRAHYLIDFDEILDLAHKLLLDSEPIRSASQARWDHVLVDELQDLDTIQYGIIRLLAEGHRSLFAVGDDEQSIFSWRGADPRVIERLLRDFAIAEPILLDVNCRCSRTIFEAARKILPPCELFDKEIHAIRESPFPVRARELADEVEEVEWVLNDLREDLAHSGLPRGEYAVLYRRHEIGRHFEEALVAAGIPCQLGKGQALADDPVIGQVIAALRVLLHSGSELELECLAQAVLPEAVRTELRQLPGDDLLARVRTYAEQKAGPEAVRCWRFLYQVENLKGLGRLCGSVRDAVEAVLAEGLGSYENPVERCHEQLTDPHDLPAARELGEELVRTAAAGGRVLLTPADGLEIVVKVMLQRTLPGLGVAYLGADVVPGPTDLLLVLDTTGCESLFSDHPSRVLPLDGEGSLRITQLLKALQCVEARAYRPLLTDYVAFDTETTGTDIERCEVIELAAVKVRGGRIIEEFHALVRPKGPVPPGATAIHGYTTGDLAGQPTFAEVWPRYRAFVGDLVQVAHNAHRFDVPLLRRQAAHCGGDEGLVYFDTLTLARSLYPSGSLRLVDLAERFGVPTGRSHHALDDARCLAGIFEELQAERLRRARKTCLPNLLDCLALGAAIEAPAEPSRDDQALRQASPWDALARQSSLVDTYLEEAECLGGRCVPLPELIERMGGQRRWGRDRTEALPHERYPEAYARLFRLLAKVRGEGLHEGIRQFLDMVALSRSDGAGVDRQRVNLLTFHATKGLEFSRVYIVGVEDNQLPGYPALADGNEADIREARRLLYVAMTRAKDRLTLTYCRERKGQPTGGTQFLEELGLVARPQAVRG